MKASEIVRVLQEQISAYGDLDVAFEQSSVEKVSRKFGFVIKRKECASPLGSVKKIYYYSLG